MNAETEGDTDPGLTRFRCPGRRRQMSTRTRRRRPRRRYCVGPGRTLEEPPMSPSHKRLARVLLLAGGITAAIAFPAITGTPLLPSAHGGANASIVLAAPANNGNGNSNNADRTNDNSEERNIE